MFYKEDIRKHFNSEELSVVNTDTSDKAIAGVLQQKEEKKKLILVVCYIRLLINTEQQYNIYNKELLAIVYIL